MKTKQIYLMTALLAGLFIFSSCEKEDETPMPDPKDPMEESMSIADLASTTDDLSILVEALDKAGLVNTMNNPGTYTVFAPTNAAFEQLFSALGVTGIDDISAETLTPILLYHVLGSEVKAAMVQSGIITSLNADDPEIVVEASSKGVYLNGAAMVTATDIMANNGVVHLIDQVILPINNGSILDAAMGLEDFSSLVAALAKANLASMFIEEGDYTVFAPTNAAFSSFLSSLGVSLDDLSAADLSPILTYHVLGQKAMSSSLTSGYVPTLYSAMDQKPVSLLVEVMDGVKLNGNSMVTTADVETSNGVIHVIDAVLTPTSVVDIAINNSSFTYLVEAVVKAGLVETLNGEGPFTIFAPTDEAFMELFSALDVSGIADLSAEALIPILQYHVVSGNVLSTQLSDGEVSTLNGNIAVTLGSSVSINGSSNVIAVDVQGTNGVVHVIDQVLLPQ